MQEKVHGQTIPLLFTMERLNHRQGLGFVVWGRVVDRRTVNIIAASVVSFFSTVLPIIIGLMPSSSSLATECSEAIDPLTGDCDQRSDLCAVNGTFKVDLGASYEAQAAIAAALSMLNSSCVVNVTIGRG